MDAPPADLRVRLDPAVLVREDGCLLIGGSPSRLVRLRPAAAGFVARWREGDTIGDEAGARALARRLLEAGVLLTDPAPAATADLVVVIPAHGREASLARCLEAVRRTVPDVAVLIVDDGSPDPAKIAAVAAAYSAEVTRHPVARGRTAARNTGLRRTVAALIAFVDSDVVVDAGCLNRLAGHFSDPRTGAVAPRVRSESSGDGRLATYEARHSSLDMGPRPALVRPWSPVPYIPSATLVVRRAAAGAEFDETLPIGEDVDFIWRMAAAGWAARYDPAVTVRHELRPSALDLARRRFTYATSIGMLAARHPEALPAICVDAATGIVILALLRRPWLAAALASGKAIHIYGTLRHRSAQPARLVAAIGGRSLLRAVRSLAFAVRRPWWPLCAAAAIRRPRTWWLLGGAWSIGRLETRTARPSHAALAVADDLISGAGTWWSCLRHRTTVPLRPSASRPGAMLGVRHRVRRETDDDLPTQ